MANQVKRVDPHIERIKRNRLHPRHLELTATAISMGPNGVIRKDPHKIGFMGPNGIKRIDRANLNQASGSSVSQMQIEEQKPKHIIESPTRYIVVLPDLAAGRLSSHDKDVLGYAHSLANENTAVIAIAFGEHKETGWQDAGVDRLLELNDDIYQGFSPEARIQALVQLEQSLDVAHFLFPDSIDGGADLGRRFAAELDSRPVTHGWKPLEDSIICRASAGTQDLTKTLSKVMLLDAEVADPIDETQHAASTLDELELAVSAKALINDLGMLAVNPADISLSVAPFILSGGNGIRDWDTFHQAASILGATEGASRVAVDDGFMPRHRQVGASGIWVSARVYIAVGISGAVQHLQGISQVDKVIAINTNTKCDMIKRADLSIIADSTDILNALVELVQAQEVSEGESHAA
ncbi:MAG: electron transfer flavoprotein subunit alpha/FixB family protein [Marinomonas sp.]